MLIYHTVGHNMSVADGGDCVEATMTAEEIQIEDTDIEVVKNNEQPSIETVMQTRDEVEGLHNRREFSQRLDCLYQAMQTRKTFSIA